MAASYPTASKSFSTKATTNVIEAAHVNDLQDEVAAIESALLNGLSHDVIPSGSRTIGNASTFWDKGYLTALILGAETTSGIRLEVDGGVLGVREGDDSAFAPITAGALIATTGTFSGAAYIGDTSNANVTLGLTINQGGADDEILAFKSSDIAHGVTALTETDSYGFIKKMVGASGGLQINGLRAGAVTGYGLYLRGIIGGSANTDKTTGASGIIELNGAGVSGTSTAAVGANGNLVVITNNGTTRFIFDADGDSHQDVGTAWTNFDSHDDALVLDSLAYLVSRDDDPYKDAIRKGFGDALESMIPRQELERIKLVTFNEDGHHFVNMSKLTMLLTGAVRQVAGRMREIEARIDRALPEAI